MCPSLYPRVGLSADTGVSRQRSQQRLVAYPSGHFVSAWLPIYVPASAPSLDEASSAPLLPRTSWGIGCERTRTGQREPCIPRPVARRRTPSMFSTGPGMTSNRSSGHHTCIQPSAADQRGYRNQNGGCSDNRVTAVTARPPWSIPPRWGQRGRAEHSPSVPLAVGGCPQEGSPCSPLRGA